ncbi:hypothetical protein BDY24DRAFT_399368 [Mrakia frigida]|uniref:uncharacterized protein n=1 Tax=Mrakia frigida TaxID=29902 RepID=UPI003FCC22A2
MRSLALLVSSLFVSLAGNVQGQRYSYELENDVISQPNIKTLAFTRLDPILTFGGVSSHMHAIVGGSNFGPSTNWASAVKSECTTMPIETDKSNYWLGPIYHVWENRSLSAVPIVNTNITYLLRPPTNGSVTEFPPGFEMLSGSITRKTYSPGPGKLDSWIWYECTPSDGSPMEVSYGFPNKSCDYIDAVITFPWCWNGQDLTPGAPGPKFNAHVIFGMGLGDDWVECTNASHPIRLPRIEYRTLFNLTSFPYRPNSLSLSTGDTLGFHLHADFLNGWPFDYLKDVFETRATCRGSRIIGGVKTENCTAAMKDINTVAARNCVQSKAMIPNEPVGLGVPIDRFPGCNPGSSGEFIYACNDTAFTSAAPPNLTLSVAYYGPDRLPVMSFDAMVEAEKKKTSIGAIVGGVLGGVAVLSAIASYLFYRHQRAKARSGGLSLPTNDGGASRPPPTVQPYSSAYDVPTPMAYRPSSPEFKEPPRSPWLGEKKDPYERSSSPIGPNIHLRSGPTSADSHTSSIMPSLDYARSQGASSPAPSVHVQTYHQPSTPASPLGFTPSMSEKRY